MSIVNIQKTHISFLSLVLFITGCQLVPPSTSPEDSKKLQQLEQNNNFSELEISQDQESIQQIQLEIWKIDSQISEIEKPFREAESKYDQDLFEYTTYNHIVESVLSLSQSCDPENFSDIIEAASFLREYVSDPTRDSALKDLEKCRQVYRKESIKKATEDLHYLQDDFLKLVEDSFDESNPYNQGDLIASRKGNEMIVKMRGNFEGRSRHSQEAVDFWCSEGIGLFDSIRLKNSHGTFVCKPSITSKETIKFVLEANGLASSWVVEGTRSIPQQPEEPLPLTDVESSKLEELKKTKETLQEELKALLTRISNQELVQKMNQIQIDEIDLRTCNTIEKWSEKKIKHAKNTQVAGALITASVALSFIGIPLIIRGSKQEKKIKKIAEPCQYPVE